jgi:hypothetical protein
MLILLMVFVKKTGATSVILILALQERANTVSKRYILDGWKRFIIKPFETRLKVIQIDTLFSKCPQ